MKLEFYNCPEPHSIKDVQLPDGLGFLSYRPDFSLMKKIAVGYKNYPNLLILAHGGSLTSFYGFYNIFSEDSKKKVYFLSTTDPDYIFELKKKLNPSNTVVVAISKSGENTTHLEMLTQFIDFPLIVVTGKSSPLRALGEKIGAKIVMHPSIGGRYSGFTEVGLLPAALCGLDIEALFEGGSHFYKFYRAENFAFKAASVMYKLEKNGFVDVFMPIYSHSLFAMSGIIVQLCHESFGKEGKGQTYFAHEAPESQHHTNQRFFGGIKNICGLFTTLDNFNHSLETTVPASLHSVQVRGRHFVDINKIPLASSMAFEAQATMEDARIQGIPLAHLSLTSLSYNEVGQFLAFWQLFAIYSSLLRKVDPFDQPQVENSKNISFNKRLAFKGLL